jgi:glycosyltransferase involved in cell wall biosynthesis
MELHPTSKPVTASGKVPRILYITPFWPQRAGIGAEVRSRQVLLALQQLGEVDVLVLQDEGADAAPTSDPTMAFNHAGTVTVVSRPAKGVMGKLRWMLDPHIQYPHGCGVEATDAGRAFQRAAQYDLVWFFKLRTPNLFPQWAWPRSVVDIDDVPSTFEAAATKANAGLGGRLMAHLRRLSWQRREKVLGERFSVLTVCSEGDRRYLKSLGVTLPTHVIPNGFVRPAVEPQRRPVKPARIGFIGSFDYFPNREGIEWFVQNCWPIIKRDLPDARLRLVGRGSDDVNGLRAPDVDVLGWMADPAAEISSWAATVVPIHVGAGTRVKIAQAFGEKCPIVSTSFGAYGYDPVDGREMYLADTAEDFAAACLKAVREPEKAMQMAERAWQQFLARWTWESIQPRIRAAAEDCLRSNAKAIQQPAGPVASQAACAVRH